jgi:hypothetical protein
MSTLRDRLARASVGDAAAAPQPSRTVIPYDCIRDFLEEHRMVQLFGMSTRDLHSALLYVDRNFKAPEEEAAAATSPPPRRPYDCTECNAGYFLVDEHNGHYVCEGCGAVPHYGSINVEREWVDDVTEKQLAPRHTRTRYIPGVSKWMIDKLSSNPRMAYERSTLSEMENMNGYMHLSPDRLHAAHRNFLRWTENGYSRDVKMAACMFHTILHSQFLTDAEVRGMVRKRKSIPQVEDPTPEPTFPCRCGVMHHSKKAARFHSCRHE